jgi:hypothetical protein
MLFGSDAVLLCCACVVLLVTLSGAWGSVRIVARLVELPREKWWNLRFLFATFKATRNYRYCGCDRYPGVSQRAMPCEL